MHAGYFVLISMGLALLPYLSTNRYETKLPVEANGKEIMFGKPIVHSRLSEQ